MHLPRLDSYQVSRFNDVTRLQGSDGSYNPTGGYCVWGGSLFDSLKTPSNELDQRPDRQTGVEELDHVLDAKASLLSGDSQLTDGDR